MKLTEQNESLKADVQKINLKNERFDKISKIVEENQQLKEQEELRIKLNFMTESALIDKPESIQFLKTHVEEALGQ